MNTGAAWTAAAVIVARGVSGTGVDRFMGEKIPL